MFFVKDTRAQGSEDYLAQDINRLEFLWQDGLNKTLFQGNETIPEGSCLLMNHVKGQVLEDIVANARSRKLGDVPRVLAPDQVLQSHQVAAIHDSWWPKTVQETEEPHRVLTVSGDMQNQGNFHHGTYSFLQMLPVTVTKDLRALGAQDTQSLQVPFPCQHQGPLYARALGPQMPSPAVAEKLTVAALTTLPDPPPRASTVPTDEVPEEKLSAQAEEWVNRATEDLALVQQRFLAAQQGDQWAAASFQDWGIPGDKFRADVKDPVAAGPISRPPTPEFRKVDDDEVLDATPAEEENAQEATGSDEAPLDMDSLE